jgi:hypothetical protein
VYTKSQVLFSKKDEKGEKNNAVKIQSQYSGSAEAGRIQYNANPARSSFKPVRIAKTPNGWAVVVVKHRNNLSAAQLSTGRYS